MTQENDFTGPQTLNLQQAIDLAVQYHKAGKLPEAEVIYQQVLTAAPDHHVALHMLGLMASQQGKNDQAEGLIRKAIGIKPDYAEAHSNLGIALQQLGRLDEAVDHYLRALTIKPGTANAHNNLGLALQELERWDEAAGHYRNALALKPGFTQCHTNLAILLNSTGQRTEALRHFKSALEMARGNAPIDLQHPSFRFISKAKMDHDIEQFHYLTSLGLETARFQTLAEAYQTIDAEIDWPNDDGMNIPLSDTHRRRLADSYNRPIHLLEAPEIEGATLNPALDIAQITKDYFTGTSDMTSFDGLLNPRALESLRRFLLGSTIWFDIKYTGGYLGAMLSDGLACPLLLQIADDLSQTFPDIFQDHKLTQLWAYKYDSQLTGISVHADSAAVNVNFWITPETANLDPDSGGLVVYDVEAPGDWDFNTYNNDPGRIRQFLADHNSGKEVVPYGENRIVLFNSNLFHATDKINFRQGYENRRINVTMLFGKRVC